MKYKLFVLIFISFFLYFTPIGSSASVFINEVAWMGTSRSANDEWIELYNNEGQDIDLKGWKLESGNGKIKINLTGPIKPNGFYLLERTNDKTVPNIGADQIYTGALENNGEILNLYDNNGIIIDYIDCGKGWFAGNNVTKQTMERKSLGTSLSDWATSINNEGTPKEINSVAKQINSIDNEVKIENSVSDKQNATGVNKTPVGLTPYPEGIVINEILPAPSGDDADNEWIELYSQNNEIADLSGWKIKDSAGKQITFTLARDTLINPNGFLIFFRKTTKIILNNDGDGISLISPDGRIVDSVNYPKAPINESYSRNATGWAWNKNLTPGSTNVFLYPATNESVQIKTGGEDLFDKKFNLASIVNLIPKKFSKQILLIFACAIILAIISGFAMLVIKKKIIK